MREAVVLITITCIAFVANADLFAQPQEIIDGNIEQVGRIYNFWDEALDVAVQGDFAYVATGLSGLQILDISDPENPVAVGSCDNIPGSANGVFVLGDLAFVADGTTGPIVSSSLRVLDISDPENPVEVGSCDTPGRANDIMISGGYAYVSDQYIGLIVFDLSEPDGIHAESDNFIPSEFYLSSAYPNPFNSMTRITYSLPVASRASRKLYDLSGREVMFSIQFEINQEDYDAGLVWFNMPVDDEIYWAHAGNMNGAGNQIALHPVTTTGTLTFTNRRFTEIEPGMWDIFFAQYDHSFEWMNYGAMEGVVLNAENDEPIAGATISTTYGRIAETDEEGFYHLPFGDSDLTASAPGYIDLVHSDLELNVDETLQINFELLHPELSLSIAEINVELEPDEETEISFTLDAAGFSPRPMEERISL